MDQARGDENRRVGIAVTFAAPTELPRDLARQQIDGEQVIDPAQPTVALQIPQVGVGHLRAQRGQALVIARIGDRDRSEATRGSR